MSYRDCLACKDAGTTPIEGANVHIVYDPAIQMPGTPTVQGHRISAHQVAEIAYQFGVEYEMRGWELTREEVLVACWWAGNFGSRKLKKLFSEWAKMANAHLWYQCINIPDPPRRDQNASNTKS